jgi:aromatic ring-opening dioxygenase LigB subunit
MSFGFTFAGKRDAVVAKVKDVKGYGDESQLNRAKASVVAELEAIPENVGVIVNANGHHDHGAKPPYGNVTIDIKTLNIVE